MAHGIFCFCPRCLGSTTSKKGANKNRENRMKFGNTNPKPKPKQDRQDATSTHSDGTKSNRNPKRTRRN